MPWDINREWQLCGWEFLFPTEEELFAYMVHMVNVSRSCLFSEFPLSRAWVSASPVVLPSCPDLTRPPFFYFSHSGECILSSCGSCAFLHNFSHLLSIWKFSWKLPIQVTCALFNLCVHVRACVSACMCECIWRCSHVEVRGQLFWSCFSSFISMWVLNSCHQACTASAFTCWATLLGPS